MQTITVNAEFLFELGSKQEWINRVPGILRQFPKKRRSEVWLWLDSNGNTMEIGHDFQIADENSTYPCKVYRLQSVAEAQSNPDAKPTPTDAQKLLEVMRRGLKSLHHTIKSGFPWEKSRGPKCLQSLIAGKPIDDQTYRWWIDELMPADDPLVPEFVPEVDFHAAYSNALHDVTDAKINHKGGMILSEVRSSVAKVKLKDGSLVEVQVAIECRPSHFLEELARRDMRWNPFAEKGNTKLP